MAETVWYYARGEVERGPFTTLQIKALANAGKLRGDDLVWKEGMENWTSAAEVAELFVNDRPIGESKTSASVLTGDSPTSASPGPTERLSAAPELKQLLVTVGRGCLLVGIVCVVLVRGCESLGERRITRLDGIAKLRQVEQWRQDRSALAAEQKSLENKLQRTSNEQVQLREITNQLNQMDAERASEHAAVGRGIEIANADSEFRSGSFIRGLSFQSGVLFLLAGAFTLASFAVDGRDRWFGIAVLVVICFCALSAST